MSPSLRSLLTILSVLATMGSLRAQQSPLQDVVPAKPRKTPGRRELDRLEALKLYGLASLHENKNRLPEALKTYEKALRLDPQSTAIRHALLPLYLALDRQDDALRCCRQVLKRDPGDFDTWYLYGRQLRALDKDAQACAAFAKALACKRLGKKDDRRLTIAYELGALQEKRKAFAKAEAAFRQVVELLEHPGETLRQGPLSGQDLATQAAETYERIGRLCLRAGQPDRAVAAFKKAGAKDPSRAGRLSFNLAEVLAARGQRAEALRYVNQYLGQQPQATDGYELKIKLLQGLGRRKEVVPELEKHAAVDRFNNALKLVLGREYRRAGQREQAERLYEVLLAPAPDVEAYRGLFAVYKAEGRAGATKLLTRLNRTIEAGSPADGKEGDPAQAARARAMLAVLREDTALVKALLPVARERILKKSRLAYRLRVLLAVLAERAGSLDAAEALYRSSLNDDGRVLVADQRRQAEAQVYSGLLKVLALAHKQTAIVELCQQGLKHADASNKVLFYLELAHAHMALNRVKEALEAVNRAVETAVDTPTAKPRLTCRCSRAGLLAQAEKFKEAEAECQALLKEYKDEADIRGIRFTLSAVHSLAHQYAKAEEQLQAILKEDPISARANNDLGYLWADQNKNLAEAERMIRKALELDEQQRRGAEATGLDGDRANAAYIDSLGWVLFRRGKLKEARRQLEKAARLPDGADDPVVWDHLGDVCARLGDGDAAVTAWKQALKRYDEGRRRKTDGRAREITDKLKLWGRAKQPR